MDDIEWQTEEQRQIIELNQSHYMRGYKYGFEGKYPKPAGREEDWNEGYEDGWADWLNSINGAIR